MFLLNYNGGPEIQLSKNDDIYVSFYSMSKMESLPYSTLRDMIITIQSTNDSTINMTNNDKLKNNHMINEESSIDTHVPTSRDQKNIKINQSNQAKLISNIKK